MKKGMVVFLILLSVIWLSLPVFAQDKDSDKASYERPWEKFSLELGGFLPTINSEIQLGIKGAGVGVDVEELLGLDTTTAVFRTM